METIRNGEEYQDQFLQTLNKIIEKQGIISKFTAEEFLHEYSFSEIHCIEKINQIDHPNITRIADSMKMTRGGVSKIITRLKNKECITPFKENINKKEIYFKLTALGLKLDSERQIRHDKWVKQDKQFLSEKSDEEVKIINSFLSDYDSYLNQKIQKLSSKSGANL